MNSPTFLPSSRSGRRLGATWRRRGLIGLTAVTSYSMALGWQAQLVSYPLYRAVDPASFPAYHLQYNDSIPLVVILPGFVSFLAAAAFHWTRPAEVPRWAATVVGLSGVVSLAATVAWAIPMHDRLDEIGQSAATIDSLLQANLVRSLALTVGTLMLCWCISRVFAVPRTAATADSSAVPAQPQ